MNTARHTRSKARTPANQAGPVVRQGPTAEFESLKELAKKLALDLRWSWNHKSDEIWQQIDPELWEATQNPWVVLQSVSRDRVESVWADADFRRKVDALIKTIQQAEKSKAWFEDRHPRSSLSCVAYFSMEFMLSEALPIYSGGLGNVAGDQLKAASDLGVPVVGVGLLYQQGYFRQIIDRNGVQEALYPFNDPSQLPITPVRTPDGAWLRIQVKIPDGPVWLRAWQVKVGRAVLYLLDINDAANLPVHRGITGELYGGGPELRLKQELILGIGGWRLLRALGLRPEVCHLNEGHAAFAVLERARSFMEETGQPFDVALAATRAGNLFTTHTAVAAGFDRFAPELIERYLGHYARALLRISVPDLLALGRQNRDDPFEEFNMAYLAIRGSGAINGVSRLHASVSRRLFAPLFPRWPESELPVGHVTNGIHVPAWDSAAADRLWTEACGSERWLCTAENLEQKIRAIPDAQLWEMRSASRKSLVENARRRLARDLLGSGASPEAVEQAKQLLDPDALTLGFARRFALYKRPNLLLWSDPARLLRLLTDPKRPLQLIIAGKAHPADQAGQALIQQWVQFIRQTHARFHVIFLADYDMSLAEQLVQGVDVWINTPRRPWEASGTSGMKVLVNGGLNLSELDGWWAEAYTPEVGWALGDGREHGDDPAWDAAEADALYNVLEKEVVPEFYSRDEHGRPRAWLARIRASMGRLTPLFSATRVVREYTERYYLPAATSYHERAADRGSAVARMVELRKALEHVWPALRFGETKVEAGEKQHVVSVELFLPELDPHTVRVELYADGMDGSMAVRHPVNYVGPVVGAPGYYSYRTVVPATRPAAHYTARVVPNFKGMSAPLEISQILWKH